MPMLGIPLAPRTVIEISYHKLPVMTTLKTHYQVTDKGRVFVVKVQEIMIK